MKKFIIIVIVAGIIAAIAYFGFFRNHVILVGDLERDEDGNVVRAIFPPERIERVANRAVNKK